MSQGWFTHATPTLYNAGDKHELSLLIYLFVFWMHRSLSCLAQLTHFIICFLVAPRAQLSCSDYPFMFCRYPASSVVQLFPVEHARRLYRRSLGFLRLSTHPGSSGFLGCTKLSVRFLLRIEGAETRCSHIQKK
jgi:hypothetical protein